MKTKYSPPFMKATLIAAAVFLTSMITHAAEVPFSSGSTGADGALNVTTNTTLDLPPDGIFHFTTVYIPQGRTLRFNRNPLNTPVYILATEDVVIQGDIDVSGKAATFGMGGVGGPGGFDGGKPANGQFTAAGDGQGPGAGRGLGMAGFGTKGSSGNDGNSYGNSLIMPLIGGSGGGGGSSFDGLAGGGGGGGAILIASTTKIDLNGGRVLAQGSTRASGGAIRLVAPTMAGTGHLYAQGNDQNGRIRVDAITRFQMFFQYHGTFSIGRYMQVFPSNTSRLDVIEAAGAQIAEGHPTAVSIQLPLGATTNQTVRVQAKNFSGVVPILVVVTPDAGGSSRYEAEIDMAGGATAQTTVNVVIPAGTTSTIHAWTR